jgi:SAM-dependent methyltransferase
MSNRAKEEHPPVSDDISKQLQNHLQHPAYSLRRYFVDQFFFGQMDSLPEGSRILDIGGHKIRKRGQFDIEQYNLPVIYMNLTRDRLPDVQADAFNVPLASGSFDVIICAELLEHVSNPGSVLIEAHRLLRTGGTLLICAPFLYRIHSDPKDFGRYTDYYWQTTLEQIGFQVTKIERQGLFFVVIMDFVKQYAAEARWHKRRLYRPLVWTLNLAQHWALGMEQKPKVQQHPFFQSFTTGFGIRGRKQCS